MTDNDISEMRRQHIIKAFFEAMKSTSKYPVTQDDIIRSVMMKGAPRFYIGYASARRYVSKIERGKPLGLKNKNTILMYEELHRRYKAYKDRTGIFGYSILEKILQEKAPSYYIDLKTFREIIYDHYRSIRKCHS